MVSVIFFFFFKQKTAYEMRISDWSSDVCSSDLAAMNSTKNRIPRTVRRPGETGLRGSNTKNPRCLLEEAGVNHRLEVGALLDHAGLQLDVGGLLHEGLQVDLEIDWKSTRLNSSH